MLIIGLDKKIKSCNILQEDKRYKSMLKYFARLMKRLIK